MGTLLDLLQAAAGESSLRSRLGRWRQEVSVALDSVASFITIVQGGGNPLGDLDIVGTKRAGAPQIGIGLNSDVVLNNLIFTRGTGITYDFNTGIYTLAAGKIYELDASGPLDNFSSAAGGFMDIAWVDAVTNVELFSSISGIYKPSTNTGASSESARSRALFTSDVTSQVKLRVIGASGTADVPTEWFGAIVKQLR